MVYTGICTQMADAIVVRTYKWPQSIANIHDGPQLSHCRTGVPSKNDEANTGRGQG